MTAKRVTQLLYRTTTGVDAVICFSKIQTDVSSTGWRTTDGRVCSANKSLISGNVVRKPSYVAEGCFMAKELHE